MSDRMSRDEREVDFHEVSGNHASAPERVQRNGMPTTYVQCTVIIPSCPGTGKKNPCREVER